MDHNSTPIRHSGSTTVLLVENDALISLLIEDEVRAANCIPEIAHTRQDALFLIEKLAHIDAAIVTLNVGHAFDGKTIIHTLRNRWKNLPIIVLTGYAATSPEADLRGLRGPMVRLHKPIDIELLRSLIASLTSRGWHGRNPSTRSRKTDKSEATSPQ